MSSAPNESQLELVQNKSPKNLCEKYFGWIRYTTVEVTVWLYMTSYMMTSVVEQDFYVQKSCRVDHGFSDEICKNLTANATLQAQVQVTVSTFHQWNEITNYAAPIILSLFFGSWSDRRGRKCPILIALVGKIIFSSMIVVNSLMDTWNLNMVIYTASLPMALLGSDVAIFAGCYTYITDVSSSEQRTLRVTILDAVFLSTMPIGIAVGSHLFTNVVKSSYTIMFSINGVLLVLAFIYSALRLEMRTTPQQRPMEKGTNPFLDFFDTKHVVDSINTLIKPRPAHRRLYLWILLSAMALYTFQRNERSTGYLYTQLIFSWDVSTFSQYRTLQTSLWVVATLFGVPILSKLLGMRDTMIVVVGALSHAAGRVFFAFATNPALFYAGTVVSALGPVILPVIKSMASKVVPEAERGKVFAFLSVCDNAAPLISAPMYAQLYKATLTTLPSAIYWLSFASQFLIFLLIMVIQVTLGSRKIDCENQENAESSPPKSTEMKISVIELKTADVLPA